MSFQVANHLSFHSSKLSILSEEEKKKGKISFSILPLRYDEKPFYFKISGKLKIFQHDESSFTLAIQPDYEDLVLLAQIANKVVSLANSKNYKRRVFEKELILVKTDKREHNKVFAKLYCDSKNKITARFSKKDRSSLDPHEMIGVPLKGKVILHLSRIFLGNISSLTVSVREVLVENIVESVSLFDEYDDLPSEEEEYFEEN